MRKRDNIDYRKVTALLDAWESASLSEAGEQELDDAVSVFESDQAVRGEFLLSYPQYGDVLDLYVELKAAMCGTAAARVADSDYASLAHDADALISGLAAREKKGNRRRLWRIAALGAAAACAAIAVVTAWMNVNSRESQELQPNVGMASMIPADTVKEISHEQYARQEATAQGMQKVAPRAKNSMASVKYETSGAKKQTSQSDVPTEEEAAAWQMFMQAREEMAEVVKPDMVGAIWNDVPDLTGQNVTNNDINLPVGIYESLETAGDMFNSIYSGQ